MTADELVLGIPRASVPQNARWRGVRADVLLDVVSAVANVGGYRPRSEAAAKKFAEQFPKVELFTLAEIGGTWQKVQKTHFADGGIFDQIQRGNR